VSLNEVRSERLNIKAKRRRIGIEAYHILNKQPRKTQSSNVAMLSHHEIAVLFERDRHSVENAMTIVARAYTHRRLYWIKFGVIRPLMLLSMVLG
jgi:hypothetical protein